MNTMEIEHRINMLRKELDYRYLLRRNAEKEQKELEDIVSRLNKKKKEIETNLQETVRIIEHRLSSVNTNSKFKAIHLRNAKAKVYSGNSKAALDSIERAKAKTRRKYLLLDDDIAEHSRKCYQLEQEIQRMKEKLFQMGD